MKRVNSEVVNEAQLEKLIKEGDLGESIEKAQFRRVNGVVVARRRSWSKSYGMSAKLENTERRDTEPRVAGLQVTRNGYY